MPAREASLRGAAARAAGYLAGGRTRGGALAATQGQVQELRCGRAGCSGAGARGRARQGEAPALGARRQGVVQVAAGAESTSYLDFRSGDRALLRRQVSTGDLAIARLGGFALGGARGRAALRASGLPRAVAAAAAAAAAVAAAVLGRVVEQTAQAHCMGGPRPDTQTRGVRPGRPRQFDLRAVPPPPRPGPGHLAKWATPRGWAREPRTRPPERSRGSGSRSSVPVTAPTRKRGPSAAGDPRAKFPLPGMGAGGLTSTHPAPERLTHPCATPRGRGTEGCPYWPLVPFPGHPGPRCSQRSRRRAIRGAH